MSWGYGNPWYKDKLVWLTIAVTVAFVVVMAVVLVKSIDEDERNQKKCAEHGTVSEVHGGKGGWVCTPRVLEAP